MSATETAASSLDERFRAQLENRERDGQLRQLKETTSLAPDASNSPRIVIDGQTLVDFSGNDYLGFSHHPALRDAAMAALSNTGTGSSRLITGTTAQMAQLEASLAAFLDVPVALVFNSGYQANVALLSALASRTDVILMDKLSHASLLDGAILSRATVKRFAHNDLADLEKQLQAAATSSGQSFVVTESVFSMDGDIAPLADIFALCERYDAWLIIDEAHATGVFGNNGSGLWQTTGIGHDGRVIQMGTFSKALGSFGAYIGASQLIIDTLINYSRGFIYSTSLPPAVIAANAAALTLLQSSEEPTQALQARVAFCNQRGVSATSAQRSPIVPIVFGTAASTRHATQTLREAGFYAHAILPPTVPEGTARLRLTLNAHHKMGDIQTVLGLCQQLLRS